MIQFLTSVFSLFNKAFAFLREQQWKHIGRQETIKEMNDAINRQIALGEAATSISDPERDERLRDKYDRARLYE